MAADDDHAAFGLPDLNTYEGAQRFVGMLKDPASHGELERELLGDYVSKIDDGLAFWANLIGRIARRFAEHGFGDSACALIEYLFENDPFDKVIYRYINNSKSWWRDFLLRVDAASRCESRDKCLWEYLQWETNERV
jgi:hypothetical protein